MQVCIQSTGGRHWFYWTVLQTVEKGKRLENNAENLGLGPFSWLWPGLVSAASICGWALIHWGGYLTSLCRILSVTLNFPDPGWLISSTNSRLVIVKLMVKATGTGPATVGGGKECEKHINTLSELYLIFTFWTWVEAYKYIFYHSEGVSSKVGSFHLEKTQTSVSFDSYQGWIEFF